MSMSRTVKRFKETKSVDVKRGSGRKPGFENEKLARKVLRNTERNPQLSLHELARKHDVSHT